MIVFLLTLSGILLAENSFVILGNKILLGDRHSQFDILSLVSPKEINSFSQKKTFYLIRKDFSSLWRQFFCLVGDNLFCSLMRKFYSFLFGKNFILLGEKFILLWENFTPVFFLFHRKAFSFLKREFWSDIC